LSDSTVSEAAISPGADESGAVAIARVPWLRGIELTPVNVLIIAATAIALALRFYQLARPNFLFSVTEYDDGPYFGSAVRLVNGALPYKDFLLVQPPGITILMLPSALFSKVAGTAWGMASGRILTAIASAAGTALAGLLVRHRGVLAVAITCTISALYPDSLRASHTVLVEPWLVLFCLLGALALFEQDKLTENNRRLIWGALAFGFAGLVEIWAIAPVIVLAVLLLPWPRRLLRFAIFAGIGFLVPLVPFAVLAPKGLYRGLVTAQIGSRAGATRVGIWYRLQQMTGLAASSVSRDLIVIATLLIIAVVALGLVAPILRTGRLRVPALDLFAAGGALAVVIMFLLPSQFHYHFSAFLAPFLAMAVGLAAASIAAAFGPATADPAHAAPSRSGWQAFPSSLSGMLALVVVAVGLVVTADMAHWEQTAAFPNMPTSQLTVIDRIVPKGACMVSDDASVMIMADRFVSDVPGCPLLVDSIGTDYGLADGRDPATGAAKFPALVAVWHNSFSRAQYVWLSGRQAHRMPWTPALTAYFHAHFTPVVHYLDGTLFRRSGQ
jgi:alpha-1,2-mannosyltransferase